MAVVAVNRLMIDETDGFKIVAASIDGRSVSSGDISDTFDSVVSTHFDATQSPVLLDPLTDWETCKSIAGEDAWWILAWARRMAIDFAWKLWFVVKD